MESKISYRDAAGRDIKLPKEVYYRCLWTVRDIGRLKRLASLAGNSEASDEEMRSDVIWTGGSDSDHQETVLVPDYVAKRAAADVACIERALSRIPEVYREGLLDNIIFKKPFSDFAHPNTWKRWKLVFMYETAKELFLI